MISVEPDRAATQAVPLPPHHLRLREIVRANPGICLQEIADRMGLSRSAAVHQIRRMVRRQLLVVVRQGRRASHFIADEPLKTAERTLFSLMRLPTARAILDEITRTPTISWNELARRLNVGGHSIRWHVARLMRNGLIEVVPEADGRAHRVTVCQDVQRHLPGLAPPSMGPLSPSPTRSNDLLISNTVSDSMTNPQVKP
jgi:DNA-binding MarR family transcriptional regulator